MSLDCLGKGGKGLEMGKGGNHSVPEMDRCGLFAGVGKGGGCDIDAIRFPGAWRLLRAGCQL